eukprot:TRINITY_DN3_c1_g1_i1.p1 TRINITY_DN3_c1_g1~~TRINITY_DN3_c1_g1_i1.p1  ORF type:complete len:963 (+),score=199.31 TRINITY_DN3_c1_g1_i1:100-2988(+)
MGNARSRAPKNPGRPVVNVKGKQYDMGKKAPENPVADRKLASSSDSESSDEDSFIKVELPVKPDVQPPEPVVAPPVVPDAGAGAAPPLKKGGFVDEGDYLPTGPPPPPEPEPAPAPPPAEVPPAEDDLDALMASALAGDDDVPEPVVKPKGDKKGKGVSFDAEPEKPAPKKAQDELDLVKKWLHVQGRETLKRKESVAAIEEMLPKFEEGTEFLSCLLCDKQLPFDTDQYYVLEKCQHGFCVDCLFGYVEKQLTDICEPAFTLVTEGEADAGGEADVSSDNTTDSDGEDSDADVSGETDDEGPEQTKVGENSKDDEKNKVEKSEKPAGKEKEVKNAQDKEEKAPEREQKGVKLVCPWKECGCPISVADLKKGLSEFGDPLRQSVALKKSSNLMASSAVGPKNVLTNSLKALIAENSDFVLCPNEKCCNIVERMPPSESDKKVMVKDDNGNNLNALALEHYHTKRFRCRECDTIFCTECSRIPYHTGYTCQQFKAYGEAVKKCQICTAALPGNTPPYQPEKPEAEPEEDDDDDDEKGKEIVDFYAPFRPRPVEKKRDKLFFWNKKRVLREQQQWEIEKKQREEREREEQEKRERERQEREAKAAEEKEKRKAAREAKKKAAEEDPVTVFICESEECKNEIKEHCLAKHPCGHMCGGVVGEKDCLPCIHRDCSTLGQNADDFCNICWIEDLGSKPSLLLGCGHLFHAKCLKERIEARWPTRYIGFSFLDCPLCHKRMQNANLKDMMAPLLELEAHIKGLGVERLGVEGMSKDKVLVEGIMTPEAYAMSTFTYYLCFKCKAPYYGGKKACGMGEGGGEGGGGEGEADGAAGGGGGGEAGGGGGAAFDPKELVCAPCSNLGNSKSCRVHGEDFIEWKCRFCCGVATFFCGGKAHFCNPCHDKPAERVEFSNWTTLPTYLEVAPQCPGPKDCPLHIEHPPNGTEEFLMGCAMCKADANSFHLDKKKK